MSRIYPQLVATFDSFVAETPAAGLPAGTAFQAARSRVETLLGGKDPGAEREIESLVRQMETLLITLIPDEYLDRQLERYRQQFRDLIGDAEYRTYLSGRRASDEGWTPTAIRSEILYLLGELNRAEDLRERAESVRSHLLNILGRASLFMLLLMAVPFLCFALDVLLRHFDVKPGWYVWLGGKRVLPPGVAPTGAEAANGTDWDSPFSIFITKAAPYSVALTAGVLGAYVSAVNRIQRLTSDRDLAKDVRTLRASSFQLRLVPVTGSIFAFVLLMIFAGNLVQGGLFPSFQGGLPHFAYELPELSKLAVWCFIAGFSERFVPDILDRLVNRSKDKEGPRDAPLEPVNPPDTR